MSTAQAVSIEAIANELVNKCRQGQFLEAIQALYSPNIVSIESAEFPACPKELIGLDNVVKKAQNWAENTTVHSMEVGEPLIGKNQFAVEFNMDATCKMTNQRNKMTEIALYTVENGKIVREHFFYNAASCQG